MKIKATCDLNSFEFVEQETTELIGIVTVLFESDLVLKDFFKSLVAQENVRYRLYIIDNSRTDSGSCLSGELAEEYGIDADILFNGENLGVARANNQGIERALRDGCTKIVLSNNDIEFKDHLLLSRLTKLMNDSSIDAVIPKIYYHSDPKRIWCAGGRFKLHAATTPHFGDGEIDNGQYDTACDVDYAPTCFMLLRANVFREVGVMDECYFVYYDDTDFMWRMKAAGKRLHYWPSGNVWHKVSFSTGGGESLFSLYYGHRNRIIFVRKNYPLPLQALAMPYIFMTLVIKCLQYDREKREAVFRGIRDGFTLEI